MIVGIIMRKDIALHAPLWTYTEGVYKVMEKQTSLYLVILL